MTWDPSMKTKTPSRIPEALKAGGPTAETAKVVSHDERSGSVSDEFRDIVREKAAAPSQTDMREAFGAPIEEPGGKIRWSIDMKSRENRGRMKELTAAKRRVMLERNGKMNSKPKVKLYDRASGQERVVLEELADFAGRRGNLRAARSYRGMRVERGPDGMLFREVRNGEWWPVGRKCLGTPLDGSDPFDVEPVQLAPDGAIWIRDDEGEWHAGGEVPAQAEA